MKKRLFFMGIFLGGSISLNAKISFPSKERLINQLETKTKAFNQKVQTIARCARAKEGCSPEQIKGARKILASLAGLLTLSAAGLVVGVVGKTVQKRDAEQRESGDPEVPMVVPASLQSIESAVNEMIQELEKNKDKLKTIIGSQEFFQAIANIRKKIDQRYGVSTNLYDTYQVNSTSINDKKREIEQLRKAFIESKPIN